MTEMTETLYAVLVLGFGLFGLLTTVAFATIGTALRSRS